MHAANESLTLLKFIDALAESLAPLPINEPDDSEDEDSSSDDENGGFRRGPKKKKVRRTSAEADLSRIQSTPHYCSRVKHADRQYCKVCARQTTTFCVGCSGISADNRVFLHINGIGKNNCFFSWHNCKKFM
jgi:hypothetical protein